MLAEMERIWWILVLAVCVSNDVLSDKSFACRFKEAGYHRYAEQIIPRNVLPYFVRYSDNPSRNMLSPVKTALRKNVLVLTYKDFLWPNGRVPLAFDREITTGQRKNILGILQIFSNNTCITIDRKTKADKDYVKLNIGPVMSSNIGRIGGEQEVSIRSVEPYDILHVFMHVLGFIHQHQAKNRNRYVKVNEENIKFALRDDFKKVPYVDQSFGTYYDYTSVTHYSSRFGSKNQFIDTITPLDENADLSFKTVLSQSDIWKIKAMYKCKNFLDLNVECE